MLDSDDQSNINDGFLNNLPLFLMNKFFSHPIFYGVLSGSVYVGMEYLFELKSEGPYPLKKALLSFVVMGGLFTVLGYYNQYQKRKKDEKERNSEAK